MKRLGCAVMCDIIYTHTVINTVDRLLFTVIIRLMHIYTPEAFCIMHTLSRPRRKAQAS